LDLDIWPDHDRYTALVDAMAVEETAMVCCRTFAPTTIRTIKFAEARPGTAGSA
jgi:hypothetical protein